MTKTSSSFDAPMESHWHRMISEAAYHLAQKRGFQPGKALEDWLKAELLIKSQLSGDSHVDSFGQR